jgi:hypothetical protein
MFNSKPFFSFNGWYWSLKLGFEIAYRQALYHLSHTPARFLFCSLVIFQIGSHVFAWDSNLSTSTSRISEITTMPSLSVEMGLANFFVWADLKTQSLQSLPHKWLGLQA